MKKIVKTLISNLMLVGVILYLIALCIGITDGIIPFVLLMVACSAMTISCVDAIICKRSSSTLLYRFVAFFICWAGIFANQKEPLEEAVCAMIAFVGVIILVLMFVYYMNTQNTRDVEKQLN